MVKNGGGVIINTGSGWALKGGPQAASYCAAKAGVLNLTRAMAIDHGKSNIRVNCVCPGDIDTPMLRRECAQLGADPGVVYERSRHTSVGARWNVRRMSPMPFYSWRATWPAGSPGPNS